jgi:flavin reductase (DIM6/NTAB) family NADH-FMN oxidoreductase RutF
MTLYFKDLPIVDAQNFLQHAIAPRPICFASTIDAAGNVNLAPFSFFNMFSSNPPIVIFSPARRVRNNTTKHSLQNVEEIKEVVINIVDADMVHQTSLASCEYPKGINEFEKAGFTQEKATMVSPPMVKESKIKLECKVNEIKSLGTEGGAGNLVICEVLCMHVDESLLDENGKIDQLKTKQVARLGGDWYLAVNEQNLFKVPKPNTNLGVGIDALPDHVKQSDILTGNHLGQLANVEEMPSIDAAFENEDLKRIFQYYSLNPKDMEVEVHKLAAQLLSHGKEKEAWQILLSI